MTWDEAQEGAESMRGLTVLATAPSCCVPSRNQMMVAAGLALKARHVRL